MKTEDIITKIHREFETAGDRILESAKHIMNGQVDKAKRLQAMGFWRSKDVQLVEGTRELRESAELVLQYRIKYPDNKFITQEQVDVICKKYRLVCGPNDRYKGFVPLTKLEMMERFQVRDEDLREKTVRLKAYWGLDSRAKMSKHLDDMYGGEVVPLSDVQGIIMHSDGTYSIGTSHLLSYKKTTNNYMWVTEVELSEETRGMICAPKKDMDLKGLKKDGFMYRAAGILLTSPPDPVVLQPVKGGYLIVCAWGDEASDEIVVNQNHN